MVTVDTIVAGVHFPPDTSAEDIGYRALAVNLSDIAAMGAMPAWATLALTMPAADESWLEGFCAGFFSLARAHDVTLIGGDTTAGPLTVTVQIMGHVPAGKALRRSGAQPGDLVFVSGHLGDAAAGLALIEKRADTSNAAHRDFLIERFLRPVPRIGLGKALRGLASATIDISDGLGADLGHILEASGVGARIDPDRLPRSRALIETFEPMRAFELALSGGDDYELCFTLAPERVRLIPDIEAAAQLCPVQDRSDRVAAGPCVSGWKPGQSDAPWLRPFLALRRLAGIPERRPRRPFKYLRIRLCSRFPRPRGNDPGITSQIAPDPNRILPPGQRMGNHHS